jgi:hypothetical protein
VGFWVSGAKKQEDPLGSSCARWNGGEKEKLPNGRRKREDIELVR